MSENFTLQILIASCDRLCHSGDDEPTDLRIFKTMKKEVAHTTGVMCHLLLR
jgi:hypothetical protein